LISISNVIVFGGSGFLGSHVADALTNAGHNVRIYDIKKSPYLQKNQKMIVGDILDEKKVSNAIKGCDYVYNFAGMADIEEAHKKPVVAVESNILGNTVILEGCRKNKIKRFIFASTLYVYGKAGSFYRSSKQACELIIENYNEQFNLPFTVLRYGSLYGSRAGKNNYIGKIIKQAITEGKIVSFGEGNDLREYIHVEDAARNSVEILSKEFENQYVIFTGYQAMRRKDLLSMIKEIMDNKIKIEYEPEESPLHYEITPYVFQPKIAKKYVSNYYLDLGQGLLQVIHDVYKKHKHYREIDGIFLEMDDVKSKKKK
jgi:UDP-glucose 4-epimerase